MSSIITQREALLSRLALVPGAEVRAGFLGQFLQIGRGLGTSPLITLQPATDDPRRSTDSQLAASRQCNIMLAVNAGPEQDNHMDAALLALRSALHFGNRHRQLGNNTFELGTTEFFIPEGHDHIYVSQTPITLNYNDQLTKLE